MSNSDESILCTECGTEMFVMLNPDERVLEQIEGYQRLREHVIELNGSFDAEDVRVAACLTCSGTAILGPTVMLEGVIVEEEQ